MNDKMRMIEILRDRIMLHSRIEDEEKAMDIARKWATT